MVKRSWSRVITTALLLVALASVPVLLGWAQLPDPFASHWGLMGAPDAFLPLWALPLLPVALVGLGLAIAGLFRTRSGPSAEGVALLGLLGVMASVLTTSTVILNRGAETWDQAAHMRWSHLLATLVLSLLGGFVGYRVGRQWFPLEVSDSPDEAPIIEVADDESVYWIGTCQVRYPFWIAAAGALTLVLAPDPFRWIAVPFVVVALVLSHVRVVVTESGLRARLGGVLYRRIRLEDVASTRAIHLDPHQWGGWGYRMIPGGTAMVLRRGSAIELSLKSGRKFAVTVDDAGTGSGVMNGLLARRARAR